MSDLEAAADNPRVPRIDRTEPSPASEELPPLPDGGLSSAMPTWLQQAPSRPARSRAPESVDVTSLTAGVEVPEWLQELSKRVEGGVAPTEPLPTPVELIEDAGAPVGEPELAADNQVREPETTALDIVSPTSPTPTMTSPPEPVRAPEPVRSFQLRSGDRTVQSSSQGGSTQGAPLQQVDGGERLVPSSGQQSSGHVGDVRSPRSPAPEQPRSIGATVLLVLLLVGLAAVGIWYYWL
jgi:hypothetical protein